MSQVRSIACSLFIDDTPRPIERFHQRFYFFHYRCHSFDSRANLSRNVCEHHQFYFHHIISHMLLLSQLLCELFSLSFPLILSVPLKSSSLRSYNSTVCFFRISFFYYCAFSETNVLFDIILAICHRVYCVHVQHIS